MEQNQMKKNLGAKEGLAIVVGMVIGSGVFFKPTEIFSSTGAPGLGILAWIIGGFMSISGGLTIAEIGAAIPKTGGVVVYLKEIYNDTLSFLFGWAQTIIYAPGIIAALAIAFGTQTTALLGIDPSYRTVIGISIVLFLAVFNIVGGSTASAHLQTVSTICKLVPLALIIIIGLTKGQGGAANLAPFTSPDHAVISGLGTALLGVLFAYNGWINVGAMAGEMKNPGKDLPKSIIGGIIILITIYTSINIAYLFVLPADVLASTATPAADVARVLFGESGGRVITIGILISVFGSINGFMITTPRFPYSLAVENKIPFSRVIARLNKKGAPINATLFITCLAVVYIMMGQFDQLTALSTSVNWFFYTLTFVGIYILRKKQPNLKRPYKVNLYPITPCIAILGGAFVLVNTVFTQPRNALLGLCLTLVGLPLYLYKKSKNANLANEEMPVLETTENSENL